MLLSHFAYSLLFVSFLLITQAPNNGFAQDNASGAKQDPNASLVNEPVFNGKVWIYEAGDPARQTIVLVHGIGNEGATCFDCLMGELTNRYHVVTFDLPGFGRSEKGNKLYSPAKYSRFLNWVTDRYSVGKIILAGHSMGGALSLKFASDHPEKVEKLLLIDVAGILHWIGISKFMVEITPPALKANFIPQDINDLIAGPITKLNRSSGNFMLSTGSDDAGSAIRLILENELTRKFIFRNDASKIAGMLLAFEDFTPVLSSVRSSGIPTRILWGEKDTTTTLRTAKLLRYLIPGSSLSVIPNSGHSPMFDDPRQFRKYFFAALDSFDTIPDTNETAVPDGPGDDLKCSRVSDRTYRGEYGTVTIINSKAITLRNIRAKKIVIQNSDVTIENAVVDGGDVALETSNAKLTVTGAVLSGDTAIVSENSLLDLAGVTLNGRKRSVAAGENSEGGEDILFSVSRLNSPLKRGPVHGVRTITDDEPL